MAESLHVNTVPVMASPGMPHEKTAEYLRRHVGFRMRGEFYFHGVRAEKSGILKDVGDGHFILHDTAAGHMVLCDINTLGFVSFF
ncbi:MAG: hypothetical protein FWE80_08340 [Oscillospiraceae bacterium]|nr:hypothetical protein [Oscillospiraceae bacterium]